MTKLFSVYYDERDPFGVFDEVVPVWKLDQIDSDGVLVLWGGEDISPSIYGQKANKWCHAKDKPSMRDQLEIACAKKAIELCMPIVGVCRGAQLMCCLSGGSLIQHVTNHHGNHEIQTVDSQTLVTNSIHHQMMDLRGTDHKLIAWNSDAKSSVYLGEHNKQPYTPEIEPEIVFFPSTNCLAIQGHPEYLNPANDFVRYCTKQIQELFSGAI